MAKTNKEKIIAAFKDINKKEGKGTIYTIDSKYVNENVPKWSTGIEDLDAICGGGMPEGRVVILVGPESAGKTSLLYHILAQCEEALDIPIEGTFESKRAKVFGNRKGQLFAYRAKYGEDAMNKVLKFGKLGIQAIGVDSVPSLIPKDDYEKVEKASKTDTVQNQTIGPVSRLLSKYLVPIEEVIEHTGTTLIFTNQVRDKMDAMMLGEKTTMPGGRKLKHASSLTIQVARRAWIKIPNKDPHNTAKDKVVGLIMKCKVTKSKVCEPMGECEIPMFFDRGFVSFDDVKPIREELMGKNKKKGKK